LAQINFFYIFLNQYFAPHTTISCKAGSTKRARIWRIKSGVLRQCVSTIKSYDKCAVLWQNTTAGHCDRTRTLACQISKTSS